MDRVILPLPSIFARDPEAVLALRVRHADGCEWRVAGDTLTLTTPSQTWTADLAGQTLGALAFALVAAGFEVVYQNDDLLHLSALVLLEGSGDQAVSNGDHLTAYTAPLAVLLAAVGRALAAGRAAVPMALAQMILPDATAEWADLFGEVLGIPRPTAMTDADYTAHLIAEVTRLRSNPVAIMRNLRRLTGRDYAVREPWKEVAYLSVSALSGAHHLQGAPIYQYHTLQVQSLGGTSWAAVMAQVAADKPAGTVLLAPAVLMPEIRVAGLDEQRLAVMSRYTVRTFTVFWATYPWAGQWDDRYWADNALDVVITGLPTL